MINNNNNKSNIEMNNISYWRNSLLYKKTELISKCRHSQYGAKDWRQLNCNLDFNIRGYIYYIYTWLIKSKAAKLQNVHVLERNLNISFSMSLQNIYIYIYIYIYLFTLTNHRTAGEGGGHFFKSALPLPPASQTLRH